VQADDAHRVVDRRLSGRRQLPEYDKLYEQSVRMPTSPERDKLYHEMAKIIETYAPWRLDISRYRNMLAQPHVLGYKKHPILHSEWQYIDVDTAKKIK
jgi:ABC-type transport system substrate-binding protein